MILINDFKTIAVTGITGHTGRYFINELVSNKFSGHIKCMVRPTSNTKFLDCSGLDIEKVVGVITDEDALHTLFRGADAAVHIAGIRHSIPILKTAIDEGVRRLVLVHTTGIYSEHKMASEEYKRIEAEMGKYLHNSTIDVTVLRPTMIFGDMCDHNIHKFIRMVDRLPIMPEINNGNGKIQPVNARDLGKAYYQAVMSCNLPNFDYIVSGERPFDLNPEKQTSRNVSHEMI